LDKTPEAEARTLRGKPGRALPRFAVLASLCLSGCYKASFVDPNAVPGARHEEWTSFFLYGLVGNEERQIREYCQGPVAELRTGANVGTAVVSVVTLGIYTPRKVYVTCAKPGAGTQTHANLDSRPGAARTSAPGAWP
jgi:hypothetical protein